MSPMPSKSVPVLVAAPLTAVILAAMAVYSVMATRPTGSDAYYERVRQSIEDIPRTIEGYTSKDQEPLEAAQELLRPNKILQRKYTHPITQETFSILIVHCGDVRDMMGHFPPNCYPNAGWVVVSAEAGTIERRENGPIPVTRYHVSQSDGTARYARVIANTFIVPRADSPLGRDDRALDKVTRTRWSSGLGAAQIQIITEEGMDESTRARIERAVADELQQVIDAVSRPAEGERERL